LNPLQLPYYTCHIAPALYTIYTTTWLTHTGISLSLSAWNRDLYSCNYIVGEAKGKGKGFLILYSQSGERYKGGERIVKDIILRYI
jgi:hypothetical protein